MALFEELNTLMVKHRFRPNRKMGQNFIVNEDIVKDLINLADLKKSDTVLEIGAGTGFLTREIQKNSKTIAVELDKTLFELLQKELPKKNLKLVNENFLKAQLPKYNKIVSLPPYTISSKLIQKVLETGFEKAVLVLQREFAEKLVAESGFLEYNYLSVLTQYYSTPEIVKNVSPDSFFPIPNSLSSIVVLNYGKRFGVAKDEVKFRNFLKSVFRYQNKNLSNSLKCAFPFIKKEVGLKKTEFNEKISLLDLNEFKTNLVFPEEFVKVFNSLYV